MNAATVSPLIPSDAEIQSFFLTQTPDQIQASADTKWPDSSRPACSIRARYWDNEKAGFINKRTEIEKERFALLDFAKDMAIQTNTPLQTLLENGEARHAYNLHKDRLVPPPYLNEGEIQAAALEQFGPKPKHSEDIYFWNNRRKDFLQFNHHRLIAHQCAVAEEEKRKQRSQNEKCSVLNDQCSIPPSLESVQSVSSVDNPFPPQDATQDPAHLPTHQPAQDPTHSPQPLASEPFTTSESTSENHLDPNSPLGKFRAALATLKQSIQTLDETADPHQIQNDLYQLLTPILQLASADPSSSVPSVPSCKNSPSPEAPIDEEITLLDDLLAETTADPKSHLDRLPPEQQQFIYEALTLHQISDRKLSKFLLQKLNIQASATALRKFKLRRTARLQQEEAEKLQQELNELPDQTQTAERVLQQRAIQITRNKKSTPEEIYKTFTALTRYTNAQTSKARLNHQIQKEKSSSGGHDTPTTPPNPTLAPQSEPPASTPPISNLQSEISNSQPPSPFNPSPSCKSCSSCLP